MNECDRAILNSIPNHKKCSRIFLRIIFNQFAHTDPNFSVIMLSCEHDILNKVKKILAHFTLKIDDQSDFLIIKNSTELKIAVGDFTTLDLNSSDPDDVITALKTLFVLFGQVSYTQDNSKNSSGYKLEIIVKNEGLYDFIVSETKKLNINLHSTKRSNSYVIYTKNSTVISDFLIRLGAVSTALDIQNNLAIREIRNATNRQNNCFDANLEKTINSATEQLTAIHYILAHHSLDYLDENLRSTALARLANPEVSLNDLKKVMNEPISRAGLKYRLDKIISIYKELKGENQ